MCIRKDRDQVRRRTGRLADFQRRRAGVARQTGSRADDGFRDGQFDRHSRIPGGCRFQDSRSGDQSGLQSVPGGEDGGAACFSGVRQPGPETLGEPLSGAGRRCDGTGFSGTAFQRIRQRRTGIYRRERFGNGAADAGVGCGTPFSGVLSFGKRYCVARLREGLAVVDLRRAFERVLFERYRGLLGNNASVTQQLLFPEQVALTREEQALIAESGGEIEAMGFDLRTERDGVSVFGIPADLPDAQIAGTLRELLAELRETGACTDEKRHERMAAILARREPFRWARRPTPTLPGGCSGSCSHAVRSITRRTGLLC